jgi:Glucodextranase, domain B
MTELYDLRKRLERYLIITLSVFALLYGGYNAYPLIVGPKIEVFSPGDGDTVASTTFKVVGRATRAKNITLQGRAITTDPEGSFMETLVALRPYTILVLTATDGYGKTITKTLRVVPE